MFPAGTSRLSITITPRINNGGFNVYIYDEDRDECFDFNGSLPEIQNFVSAVIAQQVS